MDTPQGDDRRARLVASHRALRAQERQARLVEIHRELRALLTQEERDTYNDPVMNLGDLILDGWVTSERGEQEA